MAQAAEALGLERGTAALLAAETLHGAGLLAHDGTPLAEQRAAVTSKGGTTEAALRVLHEGGFDALIARALRAASERSGLSLVLASYPITPASELLHELARHRSAGVRTIQAEDEIAAAGMALGAAFGGALGVTATSGPGMDLKAETIGLAVMLELPMIVIDVQRAGPSQLRAARST